MRREAHELGGLPAGLETDRTAPASVPRPRGTLASQARQRIEQGDHPAAMALLKQALSIDRTDPELHLLQARCFRELNRTDRARAALDRAWRHTDDPSVRTRIAQEREACARADVATLVETARHHLRDGDARAALDVLRRCGDAADVEAYRSYAHELLRGRPYGEPDDVRWPDRATLQRVLRWLTREELDAGSRALDERRYAAAIDAFRDADRIDDRGTESARLHATALHEYVSSALTRRPPLDLDRARSHLTTARRLAVRAAATSLVEPIDRLLKTVERQRADRKVTVAVDRLIQQYNHLVRFYDRNPPRTAMERGNFRSSLAPISGQVIRLRRQVPAGSTDGLRLAELAEEIAKKLAGFR